MRKTFQLLFVIAVINFPLLAGAPKDAPVTWMLKPGRALLSDDLNQPFGKEWIDGKGKWEVVDGAHAATPKLPADDHGAVKRRLVRFDTGVIAFSFKLDGAKTISLSLNATKGHICRVLITPVGFSIVKDKDKITSAKKVVVDICKVAVTPKEWHTMVIEVQGKELIARLDNKYVAYGGHKDIAVVKGNVGLTVAGESASFKNLRVYEGTPLDSWASQKAKLIKK